MVLKFKHIILMSIVLGYFKSVLVFASDIIDHPIFKALAMIESGNDDLAVGKKGERSCYQIKGNVWDVYAQKGENFYHHSKLKRCSSLVASKYLAALVDNFYRVNGKVPSYFDLYTLWNRGVSGYAEYDFDFTRLPKSARNKAVRFNNLVLMYLGKN